MLPPGKYFVGPLNAIKNINLYNEIDDIFKSGEHVLSSGEQIASYGVHHTLESYTDNKGNLYKTDRDFTMICAPTNLLKESDETWRGHLFVFREGFSTGSDVSWCKGKIWFGDVVIDTFQKE